MLEIDQEFDPEFLEKLPYETPYFLFSHKRIIRKIDEFKECFPGAEICYAMKANSEPEILTTIANQGASFEVASKYELKMLKDLKVAPQNIIYGTSVKPVDHIKDFFEYGVDRFAFDSLQELEKIALAAPGSRVYVRTMANDSRSVFKFSEKFGTDKENVVPLLRKAKELGLKPYGISFNIGSQSGNPKAWANALKGLGGILDDLKEEGIEIEALNMGGGYPCRYASSEDAPSLQEIAYYVYEQYGKLPYKPKLLLEPGRGIIASSGILVTSVIARAEKKALAWLFLDAGTYNALFEAMAYQGSTRYPIDIMKSDYEAKDGLFALAGPTGDSQDIITREARLPKDVEVGDKLIVRHVGAYSVVVSSPFNGFPKPRIFYVSLKEEAKVPTEQKIKAFA